jgi:hypothetical protein
MNLISFARMIKINLNCGLAAIFTLNYDSDRK